MAFIFIAKGFSQPIKALFDVLPLSVDCHAPCIVVQSASCFDRLRAYMQSHASSCFLSIMYPRIYVHINPKRPSGTCREIRACSRMTYRCKLLHGGAPYCIRESQGIDDRRSMPARRRPTYEFRGSSTSIVSLHLHHQPQPVHQRV